MTAKEFSVCFQIEWQFIRMFKLSHYKTDDPRSYGEQLQDYIGSYLVSKLMTNLDEGT